jgi:hypothetical protein
LAYIISKHGDDVMERIPETIARGRMVNVQGRGTPGTRVTLNNGNNTAVLSLYRHGARDTWVLTRWDNAHSGGAWGVYDLQAPTLFDTARFRATEGAELKKKLITIPGQSRATKPLPLAANKATY